MRFAQRVARFSVLFTVGCMAVSAACAIESAADALGGPSPLLAIDQNRATVIDRIVADWGATLATSSAGISATQLREMLGELRADHLLAASLAGSVNGLRDVLANALSSSAPARSVKVAAKALGDASADLVYTPQAPCRLFDSRSSQGGQGTMQPSVRRTYGATSPVTNQGGPGGCAAGAGAVVALIQIGTVSPSGSGILQGGPQGVASFPNALILYQAGDQYGTAVAMPLNSANGQFDLQVLFAATEIFADLVGYFKPVSTGYVTSVVAGAGLSGGTITGSGTIAIANGGVGNAQLANASVDLTKLNTASTDGRYFKLNGNSFGATTFLGTQDAFPLEFITGGNRGLRLEPSGNSTWPSSTNLVAGYNSNSVAAGIAGATIAGGGSCLVLLGSCAGSQSNTISADFGTISGGAGNTIGAYGYNATIAGGTRNIASGNYAMVPGGALNSSAGAFSFAAGNRAKAAQDGMFVWADSQSFDYDPALQRSPQSSVNTFNIRATGGVLITTAVDGTGWGTWGCYTYNGAGWTCTSDRNVKRNLVEVDGRDVLDRLAAMPIYHWQPKDGPNAEYLHMGPMAQDFRASFGLGDSDKAIGLQDADGVALAAIQGLNAKLEAQRGEIAELRAALDAVLGKRAAKRR